MLEIDNGGPVETRTPSRRRPLRRRLPTVEVPEQEEVPEVAEAPEAPVESDPTATLFAQTDQRFQELQSRLDRIENAFRRLVEVNREAVRGTDLSDRTILARIEALGSPIETVAARQKEADRAADARHRAELTELARRAGQTVAAVRGALRTELNSFSEEIRNDMKRLRLDLTITARRIARYQHPSAAVTLSPELELALRESAQRKEAALDRHLAAVRKALHRVEASASPPATRGVPSADPRAYPDDGFGEIEDGLARVAGELEGLTV